MNARPHKQTLPMEIKLQRLTESLQRQRDELNTPRIRVSEASASLIRYCKSTKDHLTPSVWGPAGKNENPFADQPQAGCSCVIM